MRRIRRKLSVAMDIGVALAPSPQAVNAVDDVVAQARQAADAGLRSA